MDNRPWNRTCTEWVHLHTALFPLIQYQPINAFSLPYDFLPIIFFSLTYFIVREQYMTQSIQICAYRLLLLSVTLPVNSGLLVV